MYLPIAQYVSYGKICQFLAAQEKAEDTLYKGGSIVPNLPALLYEARTSISWAYTLNSSDDTLNTTGLYLYALLSKFLPRAQEIIGSGGGAIIIPGGGTATNWVPVEVEFTVGDPDSLIDAGETVLTLEIRGIINGTLLVFKDGSKLPKGPSTVQVAYDIVYSVDMTLITFNIPVEIGWLISIDGWRDILA